MVNVLTLAFGWEPEIRGITIVMIIFVCLAGSVYMLLGTNLGARLGLLVAIAGLFGWMLIMGSIWWAYGIGMQGKMPTWEPVQVVVGDLAQASLDKAQSLQEWEKLDPDDPSRGQAQAAADEILTVESENFESTAGYLPVDVYQTGGNTYPNWFFHLFHTPHFAIVQVQPVVAQTTDPGAAPPTPVADNSQETVSVIMVRDLGDRRFPPFVITLGSGIIFALTCRALHRRDKAATQAIADYEAAADGRELEKV